VRGEDEDADIEGFAADLAEDVEAVAVRERDIEQEKIGLVRVQEEEAFFGGVGDENLIAGGFDA